MSSIKSLYCGCPVMHTELIQAQPSSGPGPGARASLMKPYGYAKDNARFTHIQSAVDRNSK